MRTLVSVVSTSDSDREYAGLIVREISTLGHNVWSLDTHVTVGESQIKAIDESLRQSIALIIVRSANPILEVWSQLQQYAFQGQLRQYGCLKIIVVPRGTIYLEPTLLTQSVVLPPDLEPCMAARICSTIIHSNKTISSFQSAIQPDNSNAPMLRPGAWSVVQDLKTEKYRKYASTISCLAELNEYDHARELYWKVLYYSGYRELWRERLSLSNQILRMSICTRDFLNAGLVLSKGTAYGYLSQGLYTEAFSTLRRAFMYFNKSDSKRGKAICWDYLGDIYASTGKYDKAIEAYEKVFKSQEGLEQYQTYLKKHFLISSSQVLTSNQRLQNLENIHKNFASIHDYREGLVLIEIAKSLYAKGAASEAIEFSRNAVSFFSDVAIMPRNAIKAKKALKSFEDGLPT